MNSRFLSLDSAGVRSMVRQNSKWDLLKKALLIGIMLTGGALRAQPVISTLSATSGEPGSSVTIGGTGFNATAGSNAVYFGATRATVTAASATSLTVTVPVGATFSSVSVTNTGTSLTGYSSKLFLPTFNNSAFLSGTFNFEPKRDYGFGGITSATADLVAADIDGDGKTDIVRSTNTHLVILRNTNVTGHADAGSFAAAVSFSASSASSCQAVGDLNGDGKPDIVAASNSGGFSVFRNIATSGSITSSSLAARVDISSTANGPLAIGDIDGDGKPDIVQVNTTGNLISVFRNTSGGSSISFAAAVNFTARISPAVVRLADIDGDGKTDIVTSFNGFGEVVPTFGFSVFKNIAVSGTITSSSLGSRVDYAIGHAVGNILINDMDMDGKPDIVVDHNPGYAYDYTTCSICRNTSASGVIDEGSFAAGVTFNSGSLAGIGDLDGDGKPDIVSMRTFYDDYSDPFSILNYAGNFYDHGYGYSLTVTKGISMLRNISTAGAITSSSFESAVKFYDLDGNNGFGAYPDDAAAPITIADMDNDGKPDMAVLSNSGAFGILKNAPVGKRPVISSLSALSGNPGTSLTITGTNFNSSTANNSVYFGATKATVTSASTTSLSVTVPVSATYGPVSVANTATGLSGSSGASFLPTFDHSAFAAGAIGFDPKVEFAAANPYYNAFADIDGDGKPEMIVSHPTTNSVDVYRNISTSGSVTSGSFASPVSFAVAGYVTTEIVVRDMDMDGKPDIVVACQSATSTYVSILKNTATTGTINTGTFATHVDYVTGAAVTLDAGDIDGDGKPDIVFMYTAMSAEHFSMLKNQCTPGTINTSSFADETAVDCPTTASVDYSNVKGIRLADMDGDGKNDIVVFGTYRDYVEIFRNVSRPGSVVGMIAGDVLSGDFTHNPARGLLQSVVPSVSFVGSEFYYTSYTSVNVVDIDGDGKQDFVFSGDSTMAVVRNTSVPGTISMADAVHFTDNKYLTYASIGDMDGDGKPDVVCTYYNSGWATGYALDSGVLVYRNLATPGTISSGSFAAPLHFLTRSNPYNLTIVDVDGDGRSDIATGCMIFTGGPNLMCILRNNPAGISGPDNLCVSSSITLSSVTATGGTWSSSNTSVAAIGSSSGVVDGLTAGTSNITYTYSTGFLFKTITVNATPSAGTITGTATVCPTATTTLSDAVSGGTWSSSAVSVATAGSTGVVTGVSAGTSLISYTVTNSCGSATATKIVTVNAAPNAGTITGTALLCFPGSTTLTDAVTGGSWTSSVTTIATVNSAGLVTAVATGTATISYTVTNSCGSATATRIVTVSSAVSAGTITGAAAICPGGTATLSDAVTGGSWSSATPGTATVSAEGVVTGVSAGTVVISYTVSGSCGSATATTVMTINAAPTAGTITGTASVCPAATTALSDAISGGTWSSGTIPVATIGSSTGIVTGVSAGTSVISYTVSSSCGTATATKVVTVSPAPDAGTITGTALICSPGTTTLSDAVTGGTWTSSATTIATVNTAGLVTSVATGTATISYTVTNSCGSATATRIVTVSSAVSAGTITGATTICPGATATLTDAVTGGTWSSATPGIATVSAGGVVTGVSAGTVVISYTVSGSCGSATATTVMTVNAAASAGSISGASTVAIGSAITLADGVSGGTWSASNSNATVSSSGVVTGVAAGTVTISYSVANSCGTAVATKVITVGSSLDPISGALDVCAGSVTALSDATSGGSWGSSNVAVATITTSGIVTGVAAGTATITYSLAGSSVSAVITVNPLPATISGSNNVCMAATTTLSDATSGGTWSSNNASIASVGMSTGVITGNTTGTTTITYTLPTGCYRTLSMTVKALPAAITGAASLCPGSTATYTDATTGGMSWSSSNTAVGTIGATSGVLTAIATGTTTVTFTLTSGCTATKVVSVSAIPAAISGTPVACVGSTLNLTDADAGGTWSSTAAGVATIGSSTGIVTAISAGATNIIYSTGAGCNRSVAFTVNPLPAAIAGATTLCAGSTTALTDGTTGGVWTSGTTSAATIDAAGIVTGVGSGTSVISYTLATGCSRTTTVSVSGSISAITGAMSTCAGTATTLADATSGGTWSSSNTTIASVGTSGIVTGVSVGTATITYTVGGCRTVAVVTVSAGLPAITGAASVCINATTALSDAITGGTWSSSNPALGTVSASGVVTGIAAGAPTISYILGGCFRIVNVTVKTLPGAISGNTGICVGATSTVTDGTGVSWSSGTPSVATIGAASGVITGISAGTSVITFNATNGCTATKVVTVDAAPSVSAITGPVGVAIGHTITLANATPGGLWSSNNTAKATVSASGVVTGIAVPAATISYTVTNGVCNVSTTKLVSVTVSKGAAMPQGNEAPANVKVYPNPSTGMFTVETSVPGVFAVYTLEGKEVQRNDVSAGANILNLPKGLAAGIYMCRFNGADNSAVMVRLVYEQ